MRPLARLPLAALVAGASAGASITGAAALEPVAPRSRVAPPSPISVATKPWCAPEVTELEEHVCFSEGTAGPDARRTLVIYLHGSLVATPGFQYVQQRMMARVARDLGFTVLLPTAPATVNGFWWPGGAALKAEEPGIVAGLQRARAALEGRLGFRFDETFVIGFSSGAYYGSSLAVRSVLDVDGYIILAGGSSWMRPSPGDPRRAPVFVGVSAADGQTAEHSRAFAGTLAALGWPSRVEERSVGHLVDAAFVAHGLAWLRGRTVPSASRR